MHHFQNLQDRRGVYKQQIVLGLFFKLLKTKTIQIKMDYICNFYYHET